MELTSGVVIGSRYVLQTMIGDGRTGEVWLAIDREGGECACRVLSPNLAADPTSLVHLRERWAVLAQVRDPHLVGLRNLLAVGPNVVLVTDVVRGPTLASVAAMHGPLPWSDVARIGSQVATGLAALHEHELTHAQVGLPDVLLDLQSDPPMVRLQDAAQGLLLGVGTDASADLRALADVLSALGANPPPEIQAIIDNCGAADPAMLLTAATVSQRLAALAVASEEESVLARLVPAMDVPVNAPDPKRRGRVLATAVGVLLLAGVGGVTGWQLLGPGFPFISGVGLAALSGNEPPGSAGSADAPAPTPTSQPSPDVAPSADPGNAPRDVPPLDGMPDLVGKDLLETRSLLTGVEVVTKYEVSSGTQGENRVLRQAPAAGEPITGPVTLTVARSPVSRYPVRWWKSGDKGFQPCRVLVGSQPVENSMCGGQYEWVQNSWDLKGGYRRVKAKIGRLSTFSGEPTRSSKVEITIDGKRVMMKEIETTESFVLDLDITGASSLVIRASGVGDGHSNMVALAGLELLGLPGEIPLSHAP